MLRHVAYFAADDGIYGTELWCSDGALGGTRLVHATLQTTISRCLVIHQHNLLLFLYIFQHQQGEGTMFVINLPV